MREGRRDKGIRERGTYKKNSSFQTGSKDLKTMHVRCLTEELWGEWSERGESEGEEEEEEEVEEEEEGGEREEGRICRMQ